MNDLLKPVQRSLLKEVQVELQRIVIKGNGPTIVAPEPNSDDDPLTEIELVVSVAKDPESNVQLVVRLGSFWLVPALLERLKAIHGLPLFGRAAPLLYAIRDFSPDPEWIDETEQPVNP